jgi:hypothetical protein
MIGIDYVAPSDIGRNWRAGTTGEQHTRACGCEHCTIRRLDNLFFRTAFNLRAQGVPFALVIPSQGIVPEFLR